jgi:glycerol-3-phosphate dehydrogenase subunit C
MKDMRFNLAQLAPLAEAGYTIASGCPSCVLALTDDYPELAQDDPRARAVAEHTVDVNVVAEKLLADMGPAASEWQTRRLAYHAPCHLRAAGRGEQPRRLLEKALGLKFAVTNTTCCGMGGTYGLKAKHAPVSSAIARETIERIKASGAEAVVTSCGMCRTQLAAGTGLPVYHPMELLAETLSPGKDDRLS